MTISLLLVYIRCNAYPGNESMTGYNLPRVLQLTFAVAVAVAVALALAVMLTD